MPYSLTTYLMFAAVTGYVVTFYLTNYNEIHYGDGSTYDASDVPYTLAIVECCLCGATALLGAVSVVAKPTKNSSLPLSLYFSVVTLAFGVLMIVRASSLGILGGDESTCTDASLSGCPTTRYEAVNGEIQFLSPSGGDCQFWFWGPDLKARYTGPSACNGYGETNGACGPLIENYMDWTKASSYGWRDDPSDVSAASQGQIATIDKIHNMKYLFSLQTSIGNVSIPIAYTYSKQPSIASCWYWGCSQVCQPHRFYVNRWWLVSSVALFVIHLVSMVLAIISWRAFSSSKLASKDDKAAVDVENVSQNEFAAVPQMGRRKRKLNRQNPGLLHF